MTKRTCAGRPLNRGIDVALLETTVDLLVRNGYSNLTVAEVAHRAGTTMSALYRRWNSKAEMVFEAAFPASMPVSAIHTNDVAADLRALIGSTTELFASSVVRAALPSLMADVAADNDLRLRVTGRFHARFAALRSRVSRAVERGELRADLDPNVLVEIIGGAAIWKTLIGGGQLDDAWLDQLVAVVLAGVTLEAGHGPSVNCGHGD